MSFTITNVQTVAKSFTGIPVSDANAVTWTNEAVASLDPTTWPEKRFGMYGTKKNAWYSLPAAFVEIAEVREITNLLTANQSSVETNLTGLTTVADTVNITLSRDTTFSTHGIASAKLLSSEAGTQDMAIKTATTAATVSPDTYYCFGVRAKSNASAKSWRVAIIWLDENDAEIATVYGDSSTAQSADTWVYALAVSPPEAASAYVLLQILDCANTEAIWWDGAMMFEVKEEGDTDEYSVNNYRIRRTRIAFEDDDNYELRYISAPTELTAVGNTVDLHDLFKWPLAKMLASRQESKDGEIPGADQKWRQEFIMNVHKVYSELDLDTAPVQRRKGW